MDTAHLVSKFERIGARMKVAAGGRPGPLRIDIRDDRLGEYFELSPPAPDASEVIALDVRPGDRHLLLLAREGGEKRKLLCGHDERHWFVAAIPESAPVGTVRQAKEALKPSEVLDAQGRKGLRAGARERRKNAAYRRQGEWFFLPEPGLVVDEALVLRHEPLRRGSGKPHWVDACYRIGGETVYVNSIHPDGLTEPEYRDFLRARPEARIWGWRTFRRNPGVYVRGNVRHADHRTITLDGWHRVLMNTESQARAMANVAFLD